MNPLHRVRRHAASLAVLLTAAALSLGGACVGQMLVPDSKEVEMGRAIVQKLEADPEFRLLGDPEVDDYVNSTAQRLIAASPIKRSFPFTFKVCVNDAVNAFALPQTGLIEAASNESELVGVIAHEVSHVTLAHHREQIGREVLVQTGAGLIIPENSPAVASYAANIASGVGMLHFNRSQESEADRLGADTMYRAGGNPRGLRDFFEKLQQLQGRDPGRIAAILSTHPTNSTRIQQLEAQIAQFPARPDLVSDSPRFHAIQRRVAQLTGD
jgi:predicted Zn-dependent protease